MNKEQIYDAQIAPLMTQIIKVCQQHKIAMLADFAIPNNDDPDLKCTTALLSKDANPSPEMLQVLQILKPRRAPPLMMTIQHADGSKTLTAIAG